MTETEIDCIHGLTTQTCAVCLGKTPERMNAEAWDMAAHPSEQGPRMTRGSTRLQSGLPHGPRTMAKYDGVLYCGDEVEAGDMIYMRDEEWHCEVCAVEFCRSGRCKEEKSR